MENNPRYRSLFWPILLIGIGVIWLLANLGYIQSINLGSLFKLWPLILIVLGVDIMFSRRHAWVGSLAGLLVVAVVIAFLVASPSLGIESSPQTKTETFTSPVAGVKTVEYQIVASSEPVKINVMESSDELINAEITHRGTINFDVSGDENQTVRLSEDFDNTSWVNWDFSFDNLLWDIGLSPDVPTDIVLDGGSGSLKIDLTDLQLNTLRTDLGSGSSDFVLPVSENKYTFDLESGSGSVDIEIPSDTNMELTINSGSGSIDVNVPDDAEFRVEVDDDGSGSLNLPNDLERSKDSNSFSIGAWQTAGYDDADYQILIVVAGQGSGSVSIGD